MVDLTEEIKDPVTSVRTLHFRNFTTFTCLLAIGIGASYLRLKGLTFQSLGLDELFTLHHSSPLFPLSHPIEHCRDVEHTPPFFYILLWGWQSVWGIGEFSARLLPAIFGVLGVLSLYFLGAELFSRATGLMAAAMIAAMRFHIYYSQEVRSYSLIFLLSSLSFLFLVRLLKHKSARDGGLYFLCIALLIYSHYFGSLVVGVQVIFVITHSVFNRERDWRMLWRYLLGISILMVVFIISWQPALIRMANMVSFWTPQPYPGFFIYYFRKYVGGEPYLFIIFSFLMITYLIRKNVSAEFQNHKTLLFLWIFLVLFTPYIRSLYSAAAPMNPRYGIVVIPAILLMVSQGLESLEDRKLQFAIFSSIMLMLMVNVFHTQENYYQKITKTQYREVAEQVLQENLKDSFPLLAFDKKPCNDCTFRYTDKCYEYYFLHVLNKELRFDGVVHNAEESRRYVNQVKTGQQPGFWLLEGHTKPNHDLDQYLRSELVAAKSFNFHKARATLYVAGER